MKPFADGDFIKECLVAVWWTQSVQSSVLLLRKWAFCPAPFVIALRRCRTTCTTRSRSTAQPSSPSPSLLMRAQTRRIRPSWPFSSEGSPLTSRCVRNSSSLSRCMALPLGKTYSMPCFSVWSSTPWTSLVLCAWRPTVSRRWLGRNKGTASLLVHHCEAAGHTLFTLMDRAPSALVR